MAENPPQTQETTLFVYGQSGQLIGEYTETGETIREYIYLNGQPLALIGEQDEVYYVHTDHLGTPKKMTGQSQAVVWEAEYSPFGSAVVNEDLDGDEATVTNNHRFAGQYFDEETGLHYNWFRYYDPKTGRFPTSDPAGLEAGLNTYLYGNANPVKYIDPDGLQAVIPAPVPIPVPVPGPILPDSQANPANSSGSGGAAGSLRERDLGYPNGRGRHECVIKCDGVQIKGGGQGKGVDVNCPDCPSNIFGWGFGSTPNEAWNNAWDAANTNTPQGCQKRHCRGIAGSCKKWKGGKR